MKYCVKVTATDAGNANRLKGCHGGFGDRFGQRDIDQYAPSIRAVVRFNANPGAGTFTELYPTANCSGTRIQRVKRWRGTAAR